MKIIKLTEKQYNARINRAYIEGFEAGQNEGMRKAFFMRYTMNDIREIFGLPRLKECDLLVKKFNIGKKG